jgi:prophage tail gpP-like protein
VKLEVDGVQYTNFTAASCELRLDALSSSFSFDAVLPDGQALPFKGGEACKISVDGETVLTGFIEVVDDDLDGENHALTISGRDRTADLLDSTLGAVNDIRGEGLTLKALIELVISSLGLTLSVVDEVNPPVFNAAEDLPAPEPGDNAFGFIEKYARKRQVLLTSNAAGDVVIATNSGATAEGAVQHIIGADDNNVMRRRFSYDTTGRYNAYRLTSSLNPVALNLAGDTDLASVVNQGAGVFDTEIRAGRQLVLVAEAPFSDADCAKRANWEADLRKARGLIYSATVPGFRVDNTQPSALWATNKIYQIVDDSLGKVEPMLCNSIEFTLDVDGGRNTTLGFVGQNAYTLFLGADPNAKVATNVT